MSTALELLKAQADVAAETGPDMNEAVKGGAGQRLLPEGWSVARLVEYVEYGNQPQEFNGVAKEPALEFRLGFLLYSPEYLNPDGTPYLLRTYNTALSRNEKAGAYLLFKSMNWKGLAKNYAQLLGEGFLLNVVNKGTKADATKLSSRINLKDVRPPLDVMSKQPYSIPEAPDDAYRLFLWEHPTLEAWKSMAIEGVTDEGKSKDFIRNQILSALDFSGSPLEILLRTSSVAYTVPTKPVAAPAVAAALPPQMVAPIAAAPVLPPANLPFDDPTTIVARPPIVAVPVALPMIQPASLPQAA